MEISVCFVGYGGTLHGLRQVRDRVPAKHPGRHASFSQGLFNKVIME